MRPPLAGRRAAARRLAAQVRLRLEPVERVLPVKLPGFADAQQQPATGTPAAGARTSAPRTPSPEDAAARIDAARVRLRASIEPPQEHDA